MYDVFVSYSTRGAVTKAWVEKFVDDLKKYYGLNYDMALSAWYALEENEVGDNYRNEINEALKKASVFLMILDPKYITSPETLAEVNEYKKARTENNEPEHFLKIIRWCGNKEKELKNFIDSEIVYTRFTRINNDGNEEDAGGNDYINEMQNIAKAIRKRQIELSRKKNAQKLLQKLKELEGTPKIFVALAYSGLRDARSTFINQLLKTISRAPHLRNARVFPDDFTGGLLSYEDLKELFYEDNPYGRECLSALMKASSAAILLLISDKINEAEELLGKIQFQLAAVKQAAQDKKMPLHIFSDIPKEIYDLPVFKEEIDNPIFAAYENIKLIRGVDINTFIQSYLVDLEGILSNKAAPVLDSNPGPAAQSDKHIYIIEHYCPDKNSTAAEEEVKNKIQHEMQHRRELRRYLFDKKFVLIPNLSNSANLKDAADYHKNSLTISDGVIIYRGIMDEPSWCLQQQSDIYNIILDVNKAKKKSIVKAVYVDPLQEIRDREEYFYYNYDVILNCPKDLEDFICKI